MPDRGATPGDKAARAVIPHDAHKRLARESQTIAAMIACYCRDHHGAQGAPCSGCMELRDYAAERLERCRFGPDKPVCAKCPVHCYQRLRREQIRAAMENGVSHVELKSGRFPQVSGLSFRYDPERPRGQRLLETQIGGQALNLAGHYRLATTEYLAKTGRNDGYVAIFASEPGEWQSGGDLNEALLTLLSQGPIAPGLEGRIQAVTSSAR